MIRPSPPAPPVMMTTASRAVSPFAAHRRLAKRANEPSAAGVENFRIRFVQLALDERGEARSVVRFVDGNGAHRRAVVLERNAPGESGDSRGPRTAHEALPGVDEHQAHPEGRRSNRGCLNQAERGVESVRKLAVDASVAAPGVNDVATVEAVASEVAEKRRVVLRQRTAGRHSDPQRSASVLTPARSARREACRSLPSRHDAQCRGRTESRRLPARSGMRRSGRLAAGAPIPSTPARKSQARSVRCRGTGGAETRG